MIGRLLAFIRGQRCHRSHERLDKALHAFEASDTKLRQVALDIINESVGPDVQPYTLDRIAEAIADVTRRAAERARQRAVGRRPSSDVDDLVGGVLRMTDTHP